MLTAQLIFKLDFALLGTSQNCLGTTVFSHLCNQIPYFEKKPSAAINVILPYTFKSELAAVFYITTFINEKTKCTSNSNEEVLFYMAGKILKV